MQKLCAEVLARLAGPPIPPCTHTTPPHGKHTQYLVGLGAVYLCLCTRCALKDWQGCRFDASKRGGFMYIHVYSVLGQLMPQRVLVGGFLL